MKEIFYNFAGLIEVIFYYLNRLTNYSYIPIILKSLSSLFQIENFAIVYFLLCYYQYYQLKQTKSAAFEQEFNKRYTELIYIGTCYAFFGFTYAALKFSINLPRPFCSLPEDSFITIASTAHERCLSSFPSSHTGLALMVTFLAWKYLNGFMKIMSIIIALLVALSRISLAMHYPADILYSGFVVILIMYLAGFICQLLQNNVINYFKTQVKRYLF